MPFPLGQFPPSLREKALDLAVKLLETLREAWLVVLAFFLVCGDPFGRARAPLPISVGAGAGRRMASVCLVQGQSPRALRVAALFWRHYRHDWSYRRLAALARRDGVGGGPLPGGGVIHPHGDSPGEELPYAFVLSFNLETGTVTLRHTKAEDGGRVCAHPPSPLALGAASLEDVLRPLVGRRPCPAAPSWLVLGAFPSRPPPNKYA